MRGRGKRSWVKLWLTGWLHGSIRWQMSPAERSVWVDLICLAGECGQDGKICDNSGNPYPTEYIANSLNIPLDLLELTIVKCYEFGMIEEGVGIITICNWARYQSEYDRQKKYRDKEKEVSEDPDKYTKGKYGHMVRK